MPRPGPAVTDARRQPTGGSILAVVDEGLIARLLKASLEDVGYDVRIAADGVEALEMASSDRYGFVKGDEALRSTGKLIRDTAKPVGGSPRSWATSGATISWW